MKNYTPNELFEIADRSLKHSSESFAIQLLNRVFVVDYDEMPAGGVPEGGTFIFKGWEILSEDIGKLDDGSPYLENTQPMKTYAVESYHVVQES